MTYYYDVHIIQYSVNDIKRFIDIDVDINTFYFYFDGK